MGLDMFAFTTCTRLLRCVDFDVPDDASEFHYWRKHRNLHRWMEVLYQAKGGAASEFNLTTLQLTVEDLDALEDDIRTGRLETMCGFFFERSKASLEEDDLVFVENARLALGMGEFVFYCPSW